MRRVGVDAEAAVAASPIDFLIPPYYRHTAIQWTYPDSIVTIDYGATAGSSLRSYEPSGTVAVTVAPYVRRHKTEEAVGSGDDAFTSTNAQLKPEEMKANAKQGLMEVLLGDAAAGGAMLSDAGRALPPPSIADEVQSRLRGERCDATHVTSPQLMVALVRVMLANRTDPARSLVDCVTAIDISHTQLGKVTLSGPPLHFDGDGNEVPPPSEVVATRFYPDECLRRDESAEEVKRSVAERSLALTYVAPLLFTPGARLYCIRELVCSHCGLTDSDAHALALILQAGRGDSNGGRGKGRRGPAAFFNQKDRGTHSAMCCSLEVLDISLNRITDAGMAEIQHAIKHNRRIKIIVISGNDLRSREKVADRIERRLKRNRERKASIPWMHLHYWKRLMKKK
ncbi:hypothetical protein ABL78_5408 [Leptomonas seymouri]|uniref:Uncharacterized protein n=1 Tax=Leptomonas seymouri TaxID=5684 RepID=A0A0N0P532_LEPSE|nr:hypothetical protein ABL78_5408 [Leptomonas seymouri]|eukprot:KPI85527.1 hypothetical protein ABL78_5408 [Leptomonas seymouri]